AKEIRSPSVQRAAFGAETELDSDGASRAPATVELRAVSWASRVAAKPSAIGTIMAVVAVFEIHIENAKVVPTTATRTRPGRLSIQRRASTQIAARRSTPCTESPAARMKPPKKSKMSGW